MNSLAQNQIFKTIKEAKNEKHVLVEELTGGWCQWCPRGTITAKNMVQNNDKIIFIAGHSGDPMAYSTYVDQLGLGGAPSANVNRKTGELSTETWNENALAELNIDPIASIGIETTYNTSSRALTVSTSASFSENQSNAYRIGAIIIEDGVKGPSPEYNQSNKYSGGSYGPMGGFENLPSPVPGNMLAYDHVARALITSFNGDENSIPADIIANETYTYDINYTLPEEYNYEYVRVVAWITDVNTGHIVNAIESHYLNETENAKPHFVSTPIEEAFEGTEYIYNIFAADPMDDNLSITAVELPEWLTFESGSSNKVHTSAKVTGTPPTSGTFDVTFEVSDGELVSTQAFTITVNNPLAGSWEIVGENAFTSAESRTLSLKKDNEGNLYAAVIENEVFNVYKCAPHGDWEKVGAIDEISSSYADLEFDSQNNPIVVYALKTGYSLVIKKWNGNTWEQIGNSPTGGVQLDMAINENDQPVIVLQDGGNAYFGMVYEYNGSSWDKVGGDSFNGKPAVWNKIEIDEEGNIYVLWGDFTYSATYSSISKYDGSSWSIVGNSQISDKKVYFYQDMAVISADDIYVSFPEMGSESLQLCHYDGSTWEDIDANFPSGAISYSDMCLSENNTLFITYIDAAYSNTISAISYTEEGWEYIGQRGFSGGPAEFPMITSSMNAPVVAYSDTDNNNKVTVKQYLEPKPEDAQLISLSFSEGILSPNFASETYSYTLSLTAGTTVVPTAETTLYNEEASITINYPESLPGTATILVTSPNENFSNTYTVEMEVEVGLNERNNQIIQFAPNPANQHIDINIAEVSLLQIHDMNGCLVFQQNLAPGQQRINTSGFNQGIHIISLKTEKYTSHSKLMITQ